MIKQPSSIPTKPGVYIFKKRIKPIYIGKAGNLKKRLLSYWSKNSSIKVKSLLNEATKVEWSEAESEIEALIKEAELIKENQPKYNILMRDDKSYFYVVITRQKYPRIYITHRPEINQKIKNKNDSSSRSPQLHYGAGKSKFKNNYLGPFTSGSALKITLRLLRKIFPYCTCNTLHMRPCLNVQIGRCPGYCCIKNGQYSILSKKEYKRNIKNIVYVLKGKKKKLYKELKSGMRAAAKRQDFEEAAILRDQMEGLENIFQHSFVPDQVRSMHRTKSGTWSKIQIVVQSILKTKHKISRVEGYDISNISGTSATGSMVVFIDGKPTKSEYRKFKIKTVAGISDVDMHKEVISRRLNHPEWQYPDLMLIDGGKPQLNAVLHELRIMNYESRILLASLAKREEELYTKKRPNPIRLDSLPADTANFFKYVRDESHRFAKKYHHKLREIYFRGETSKVNK